VNARSVARVLLPGLVLTLSAAGRAQQASDAGSAPAPSALAASAPAAAPAPAAAQIALVLKPTDHPRVPRDLAQLWMAPEKGRVRTAAEANLATAIKMMGDSSYAKALNLLTHPATAQQGPLAAYVDYYKGLAQLKLGRAADARTTFQALQARTLSGFLVEASALREAEASEALNDHVASVAVYERLSGMKTTAPDQVLSNLAKAAKAAGDVDKARAAYERLYYEYPFSELASTAADELGAEPILPGNPAVRREMGRAERLFAAKQYTPARAAFERLRSATSGDERDLVRLRLAESDYYLKKFRIARDALKPFTEEGSHKSEALYFYALVQRDLGERADYFTLMRRVIAEFPTDRWAEEALNHLANTYVVSDDDAAADQAYRELYEKFPSSRYAERAAWKIGWRAYRMGDFKETAYVFSRASADFPRSDYRPSWLYWAGRAHDALGDKAQAQARFTLAATDYLNSYYGRLALTRLDGRAPERRLVVNVRRGAAPPADVPLPPSTLPANAGVIRELLVAQMYDLAIDELRYAQTMWGDSSPIGATMAWAYREQGKTQTGSAQFSLYRGAINLMKRAYPQYLAAGGEQLPRDILRIIFPIAYWESIQKYSAENGLDPYVVAALAAQESTFVANIRSPAKAVGLLQLEPPTARQVAKRLNMKYTSTMLTDPEANLRLGTAYLAAKVREFGDLHLVLASYNAGERPVHRWVDERPSLPREEFIDDIPYPETQNYVKRILGTAEDYRRIYGPAQGGVLAEDEIPAAGPGEPASDVSPKPAAKKSTPAKKKAAPAKPAQRQRAAG
jgi:soluble lytic murein transglycosylase